jgi:hypothetical protein
VESGGVEGEFCSSSFGSTFSITDTSVFCRGSIFGVLGENETLSFLGELENKFKLEIENFRGVRGNVGSSFWRSPAKVC